MFDHGGQRVCFTVLGDKLHIKLASAAIDRGAAAAMVAVHFWEIQLYSYNQLEFLTGVMAAGGRRQEAGLRGEKEEERAE